MVSEIGHWRGQERRAEKASEMILRAVFRSAYTHIASLRRFSLWIMSESNEPPREKSVLMKICPTCAQEAQDQAIRCDHCGGWLNERKTLSIHTGTKIQSLVVSKLNDPATQELKLWSKPGGQSLSSVQIIALAIVTFLVTAFVGVVGMQYVDKQPQPASPRKIDTNSDPGSGPALNINPDANPDTSSDASQNDNWSKREAPGTGVLIDLPGELKPVDVAVSPQARGKVKSMKSYEYAEDAFIVGIIYGVYIRGAKVSLEGGARGAMENIRGAQGVTDLRYSLARNGKEGVLANGSFKRYGELSDIKVFVTASGSKMWIVTVANKQNSAGSARRILESVRINPDI